MDVHVDRGVFIDTIETLTPAGEDPTPAAFELASAQAGTPLFGAFHLPTYDSERSWRGAKPVMVRSIPFPSFPDTGSTRAGSGPMPPRVSGFRAVAVVW